jgi:hypothetical protein
MKLARRRHRGLGNPAASSDVGTAFTWLGGGAIVGAGLGALTQTPRPAGALNGAAAGVALVGVGGLVVAIIDPSSRSSGFATAGIGLGGLALLGLTMSLIKPATAA